MVSGRRTRKAAGTVRPPGMYRAAEHGADDSAMGEVDRIFADELGWMFTRNQVREYGIDGHALVVRGDGLVTGRMLAIGRPYCNLAMHQPHAIMAYLSQTELKTRFVQQ